MAGKMSRNRPDTERMETLIRDWEAAADRRAVFPCCYLLITRDMLAAVDAIQEPIAPDMDIVDTRLGHVDEWLISRLIPRWRDELWGRATEMLAQPEHKRREIEVLAQRRAQAIPLSYSSGTFPPPTS